MPFINKSPLNYPLNSSDSIRVYERNRAPTVSDFKNFKVGDEWWDTLSNDFWKLVFKDSTQGIWRKMAGTSAAAEFFTPDAGGQVGPDLLNNINLLGGGGLTTTGNPGTNTITFAPSGGGSLIETLTGDAGGAVGPDGSANIDIVGGAGVTTTGTPGTNTLTIALTGGGTAIDTITGNAGGAVPPDGAGNITLIGTTTNGINVVGNPGGNTLTAAFQSPYADGDFEFRNVTAGVSRNLLVSHTDNTNTSSNAILDITTGGAAGGDPFVHFEVTGAAEWSIGPDNSNNDTLKFTDGANPSVGNERFAITTGGATRFNNAFTFPVVDGATGETLVTNGAGTVAWGSTGGTGEIVQVVNGSISTVVFANTDIPYDNTIPQSGEGVQILTLAITPKSATNKLFIQYNGGGYILGGCTIALFQDATAAALAATNGPGDITRSAGMTSNFTLNHFMTSGTTSSTTFKIRMGRRGAGDLIYVNGDGTGVQRYGGVASTSITIWEIAV